MSNIAVSMPLEFQSSPVPEDGRYFGAPRLYGAYETFQSSPVPEDGRYARSTANRRRIGSFNPRPSRRTGATTIVGNRHRELVVSILARPGGRALPACSAVRIARLAVSILARPGGRALPTARCNCPAVRLVSILARPGGRALPPRVRLPPSNTRFQSSPVPEDGRYTLFVRRQLPGLCFNPRPSRRTGATPAKITVPSYQRAFQSSPVQEDGRYKLSLLSANAG